MHTKLRVAWFSSLNLDSSPGASVSAYVSDELLPLLREQFEIELFHSQTGSYLDFTTHHYLTALRRHREAPFDLFFYQLEDLKSSYFSRMHLGLYPGIVLFHDFLLTDDGPEPILNSSWSKMVQKFHDQGCPWPSRRLEYKKRGPHAFREAGLAALALFSHERHLAEYRSLIECTISDKSRASFLPFPVNINANSIRPGGEVRVLGYCGTPRIEHRAHKAFQALAERAHGLRLVWLVADDEESQARELLREFEITNFELLRSRSPSRWAEVVSRCDVALHTLFSVYGQPGPYLPITLARGIPSLVTDFACADYMPDTVAFKIEPGASEARQIGLILDALMSGQVDFSARSVHEYAAGLHRREVVAAELAKVFTANASYLGDVMRRWEIMQDSGRRALVAEAPTLLPCSEVGAVAEVHATWQQLYAPIFNELGWSR